MFKKILILIIIFSQIAFAGIRINEIMANPECSDYVCEWIELYNGGVENINMTNWKIFDDNLENFDGGNEIFIPGKSFALIVDQDSRVFHNFDVGENTIWVYVDDDAIGNGLSNDGGNIILYNENLDIIDEINYGNLSEGNSYSFLEGYWNESEATPGRNNLKNESFIIDYSVIKINEFLPDPKGDDDSPMPNGEWVELYNNGNESLDLIGLELNDNYGNGLEISEVNVLNSTLIRVGEFKVIYRNGNGKLELNNNGFDKISLLRNGLLIDEVSYDSCKEDLSWSKVDGIWQQAIPTPNSANKGEESVKNSDIKIENIYDNENKWGDIIRVKLEIYKADTSKNSIKAWVENKEEEMVSEETKMNIYGKNMNYSLILPVKIIDNCDDKFDDGKYNVIVDGLDDKDSEEINIEGKGCNEIEERGEVLIEEFKSELKEENIIKPEKVIYDRNEIIYESKQDETKRAAIFFMVGVMVLLLLYYIWKK